MGPTAAATGATTATQSPRRLRIALLLLIGVQPVLCLENGLARTPPMGWLAWERFLCNVDCADDPENCVSERLFKEMANAFVSQGYRTVGYQYVNIDDCWMAKQRDAYGRLQANGTRFPNGIKHLADFMHDRGLKLGIYGDVGTKTCEKYPGSKEYLFKDAQTFAEWNVDMVKMDGCFANITEYKKLYPEFGNAINKTGRPMVYSCSWPAYQVFSNMTPNYTLIGHHCNMWRNYADIADTWRSVEGIIDYYAKNQDALVAAAAPGRWNDPDMLVIGNFGLSYDQSKAQMALWAIMAAPLLMSHDLRHTRREFRKILQNTGIIAVNQDPLGIMGKRIRKEKRVETWVRPVTPVVGTAYSYALVFFNRNGMGNTRKHVTQLRALGLEHPYGYRVTDLFENRYLGHYYPDSFLKVRVNPSGGVVMVKAEAVKPVPPACPKPCLKYPQKQPQKVLNQNNENGTGTPSSGAALGGVEPVKPQVSSVSAAPSSTVPSHGETLNGAEPVASAGVTGTSAQPSLQPSSDHR
ncbi:alpha-N-acetylgalactosaminidase isoform X1 [Rhipicephalus sanguineus]|uniref:alpha-N-acetylgalactosaminidase isoform X1 n=1 Tax=Rhipicephalus sanguineus TaxID=34632 RepID=UPI0018944301|nr:alpha-N-acetylgalactosaminidase isoform X1 [Rhipicephalus sanguineus]